MRRLSQGRADVATPSSPSPRFSGGEGLGVGGDSAARRIRIAPHPVRFASHPPRRFAGGGMGVACIIAQWEAAG